MPRQKPTFEDLDVDLVAEILSYLHLGKQMKLLELNRHFYNLLPPLIDPSLWIHLKSPGYVSQFFIFTAP